MLRLDKVIKPWKESASLNDHINLYGFWNETAFLTKSGDLGMVLSVPGVDYESLDRSEQEYAVKRLEAALKAFGPGFHVYQYLFKSNRPDIPFAKYDDPIVEAAIEQRRKFFEAKRDHLYQIEIFYCILLEGARAKTGVGTALARLLRDPEGAIAELKSQFTNDSMKTLLRKHIEHDLRRLDQSVQAFGRQLADFMQIEILNQQGQFTLFRRLLNYDDWRVAGRPQSTQFLDYQVVNSDIEAERDHLRVGDHIVRVLTMKEAITETRPLVLNALLKIPANFYVVTEWTPLPADKARKEVNKRRRHFNMSKTGFVSQMGNDATKTNPRDVLVDESKQADKEERRLWDAIERIYVLEPNQRTVSNFGNIIGQLKERLHRWTRAGQYGFLLDNAEDTLSFKSFQTFNFHGWNDAPEVLEPLLFYVLHRASNEITDPKKLGTPKFFLLDEAWLFIKNETIRNYVVQAQKTWRKHKAAMILATQSIKELEESGMLAIVAESCPTKIFLANPDMNRDVYREAFHLNDTELDLIDGLVPPGQMLIRKAQTSKKVHLNVDSVSHWMATNNARDNLKKQEYFDRHGFADGLRHLAEEWPFQPRALAVSTSNNNR